MLFVNAHGAVVDNGLLTGSLVNRMGVGAQFAGAQATKRWTRPKPRQTQRVVAFPRVAPRNSWHPMGSRSFGFGDAGDGVIDPNASSSGFNVTGAVGMQDAAIAKGDVTNAPLTQASINGLVDLFSKVQNVSTMIHAKVNGMLGTKDLFNGSTIDSLLSQQDSVLASMSDIVAELASSGTVTDPDTQQSRPPTVGEGQILLRAMRSMADSYQGIARLSGDTNLFGFVSNVAKGTVVTLTGDIAVIGQTATNVANAITSIANSAAEAADNAAKSLPKIGWLIEYGLPLGLVAIVGFVGYLAFKGDSGRAARTRDTVKAFF